MTRAHAALSLLPWLLFVGNLFAACILRCLCAMEFAEWLDELYMT